MEVVAQQDAVLVASAQLIAAIVALAGAVWWLVNRMEKGKQASERERVAVTDAALKYLCGANEVQKLTADSIGKLAEAITTQTEVMRTHSEQSIRNHNEVMKSLTLKEKNCD